MKGEAFIHQAGATVLDRPTAACMLCRETRQDILAADDLISNSGQKDAPHNPSEQRI